MGEDEVLEKCDGIKAVFRNSAFPMYAQYKIIKQQLIKLYVSKTIDQQAAEIKDGGVFINNK